MNKKIPVAPSLLAPRPLRLRIDTQAEDVRVEIIPLIDVVFCILIFFILAAVGFSRQQAISVDLPKAVTGTAQGREILVVSLNEQGQVFVEQQPVVTKDQFYQKLRDYRKQHPNGLMALYASTSATYNEVVQVLDLLREVGGDRVALATLPGESGQIPSSTPSLPPATTGVPTYTPNPGTNPYDPYGTQLPGNPYYNPAQPQVPLNPGQALPGAPGTNPGNLQPLPGQLPGQPQINPGNSAVPSPGARVAPNTSNTAPNQTSPSNSAAPSPGAKVAPNTNNAAPKQTNSSNSPVSSPGGTVAPKTNNAAPNR
jgi:biopolymer transport protein ExbD